MVPPLPIGFTDCLFPNGGAPTNWQAQCFTVGVLGDVAGDCGKNVTTTTTSQVGEIATASGNSSTTWSWSSTRSSTLTSGTPTTRVSAQETTSDSRKNIVSWSVRTLVLLNLCFVILG